MLPLSRLRVPLGPCLLFILSVSSLCFSRACFAESLKITSNPSGATVELDGIPVGTTPFEKDFPGGYFHRTHTVLGSRLEHGMVARISLAGYSTQEIALTRGPMSWIDVHGHFRGEYWPFKSEHFHAELEALDDALTGSVATATALQPAALPPVLSLEEVVRRTKPSVVRLIETEHTGSGFFITETGVIATNAHVARGEGNVTVHLANGTNLPAKVVYVDRNGDLALVKVTPPRGFAFPR